MLSFSTPRKATLIVLALLAVGCSAGDNEKSPSSKSTVTTEVGANTFRNDYFGLTVTKPGDWFAASSEVIDQVMGLGSEIASSGNDDLKKVLDASLKRNHSIFMFSKYELGSPVPLNPNIIGIAENVSILPGVKTGEDYFFHVKKMMGQTGLNIEFADGYKQRDIGGVTFDSMDLTMTMNGVTIKETYYAARHDDFMIAIIDIYGADEFKDATSKIIDSIKLDW